MKAHPVLTLLETIAHEAAHERLHQMAPSARRKAYHVLDQHDARGEFKRWLKGDLRPRQLGPLMKLVALTVEGAGNWGIGCVPDSMLRRLRALAEPFGVRKEVAAWLRESWM